MNIIVKVVAKIRVGIFVKVPAKVAATDLVKVAVTEPVDMVANPHVKAIVHHQAGIIKLSNTLIINVRL